MVNLPSSFFPFSVNEDYFTLVQTYFFYSGLRQQMFVVSLGSGTERTQNVTFCMAISAIPAGREIFGINQRKATGIIIPTSMSG